MRHVLIDLPLRFALLPVLAGQALYVISRALRLPEAAGPRAGSTGEGPLLRVLILGDSSAAGVGAPHQDQALTGQLVARLAQRYRVDWRLEARTGATTKDALARLGRIGPGRFDLVVVALGVNDVTRGVPLPVWLGRQRALVDRLKTGFGAKQIILSGLPPMGAFPLLPHPLRWVLGRQADRFDRALRAQVAPLPDVSVVTMDFELDAEHMAEDGFHPGPDVYAAWADLVMDAVTAPET